jgi:hypothetical protein
MEFYLAMKKTKILSFASKWMKLENIILSEVSQAQKTKNHMFSVICGLQIKGKYSKGIGLWSHDKVTAHKGGMSIGKKPKKYDSIRCPQCKGTNAETLKSKMPIGEGDQELEKRLVQEELI